MPTLQLLLSYISGIIIGGLAAYLGTLMLSKRMSVITDPMAHLAFPGVAVAILLGIDIGLGVFPFVIIGALIIWILDRHTPLPIENLTAFVFAAGVGTSLLFLPIEEAEEALIGNIMHISLFETLAIMIIGIIIIILVRRLYRPMMLANIHPDLVAVQGHNVSLYNLGYLIAIALVVSIGVYLVGGLITSALIAIPSGASRNLTNSLLHYQLWAIFLGILGVIIGISLSLVYQLPAGPMIVVADALIFLVSLVIRKQIA